MTFAVPSATLVTSVTRVTAGQPPWLPTLPTPCSEDDVSTVQLALDGTSYEIDLSAVNADRLREKLERFIAVGKQAAPQKSRPAKRGVKPAVSSRHQTQAIRDWAQQNGYAVSG